MIVTIFDESKLYDFEKARANNVKNKSELKKWWKEKTANPEKMLRILREMRNTDGWPSIKTTLAQIKKWVEFSCNIYYTQREKSVPDTVKNGLRAVDDYLQSKIDYKKLEKICSGCGGDVIQDAVYYMACYVADSDLSEWQAIYGLSYGVITGLVEIDSTPETEKNYFGKLTNIISTGIPDI